jgi:YedE family putative selenium metabolism protein
MRIKINLPDAIWGACAGIIAGTGSALLTSLGNPVDGGLSIACFYRDIAGSLGLHQTVEFSYLRPELAAIAIGAGITAYVKGNFSPVGGSSTVVRFVLGVLMSFGIFAFVGCPMRVGLRIAGGDPAAVAGLLGLIAGVGVGTFFLAKGFCLGNSSVTTRTNGLLIQVISIVMLALLIVKPAVVILSHQRHAPLIVSLVIGGILGIIGQRSKLCFVGGFRNLFLIGDVTMLMGFIFLVLSAMVTNLFLGQEHFGVHLIGSDNFLWSFLALVAVGIASVFMGGCPFRQLILASQGDTDSVIGIAGMITGAAIAYNYDCAFTAGSLDIYGKIVVCITLAVLVVIGFVNLHGD